MPPTIGDAFTRIQTNLTALIGTFDKAHGVSGKVAESIMWVADNLNVLIPVVTGLASAISVTLVPAIWGMTAALLANPLTWVALAIGAVAAGIVLLVQRLGGVESAFQTVQMIALDVWDRIKAGGQSLGDFIGGIAQFLQEKFTRAFAAIAQGFADLVASMGGAAGMLGLCQRHELPSGRPRVGG